MSDSEEENFCFYGKSLDPYDEDLFPKKRPISVEEQIATDSHGRRRFHGAFTGGFSAGFFNTVGSLEGWTPSEFKSGRGEKQKHITQNPEDFMDDEDMGEFGFATQSIRATKDYDTSNKRKRKVFSDGPIPGEPVLHTLFTAGNETIGYLLLKNIGIKEKMKMRDEEIADNKIYGCEIPKTPEIPKTFKLRDYKLPEIYEEVLSKFKNDTFGLGYVGLDRSHTNIFRSTDLVVHEKDRKLSVRGQAFGVGAFENEDDDIYSKEDMSNYDFEITKEQEKPRNSQKNEGDVFDLFCKAKVNSFVREIYPPPVIPKSFTGKHKVKKSRFEPLEIPKTEEVERSNINPIIRAEMLDEEINDTFTASKNIFSKTADESLYVKKEPASHTVLANESSNCDITNKSANNKEQMKRTFEVSDLWNDRFVTALQADDATDILTPVKKYEINHYTKEMRDAAKLKMFGPLTRISEDWHPCSLLCKRFNIPEPLSDKRNSLKNRSRTKNLVFEYQKHQDENITLLKPGLSSNNSSDSSSEDRNITQADKVNNDKDYNEVKQESEEQPDVCEEINEAKKDDEMDISDEKKIENIVHDEQVIDITDKLNVEEKGDLFKAIFLSSSESEEEADEDDKLSKSEEEIDHNRDMQLKSNVLGDELILPKFKPVKEGILSGLDFKSFHQFSKPPVSESKEENSEKKSMEKNVDNINILDSEVYGPKLPEKIIAKPTTSIISFNKTSDSSDEWVEKEEIKKNKKKKHKKEKSHKKKHKHEKKKKSQKHV